MILLSMMALKMILSKVLTNPVRIANVLIPKKMKKVTF
jgi:hypothetical protein